MRHCEIQKMEIFKNTFKNSFKSRRGWRSEGLGDDLIHFPLDSTKTSKVLEWRILVRVREERERERGGEVSAGTENRLGPVRGPS